MPEDGYTVRDPLEWTELFDAHRSGYEAVLNRGASAQKVAVPLGGMLDEAVAYVKRLATFHSMREIGFLELQRRHDSGLLVEMRESAATATLAARAAMWAAVATFAAAVAATGATICAAHQTNHVKISRSVQ